ncbi:hypothetical protein BpHYR1_033729 [Brachionus plicatilis]|uniref:Uncharacterized protein n=1 Tax=Brachionus plicatilis TaxID=10195 RepID=A0A3M7QIK4_BRAPC|nr:hypothetical protein BpHYR1_033729 [Brachionus plicatilis]
MPHTKPSLAFRAFSLLIAFVFIQQVPPSKLVHIFKFNSSGDFITDIEIILEKFDNGYCKVSTFFLPKSSFFGRKHFGMYFNSFFGEMHNGVDLLSLEGDRVNLFAYACADVFFTRDELANCILWYEASRKSSTNREKLTGPERLGKP